jgi:hypothetical protein
VLIFEAYRLKKGMKAVYLFLDQIEERDEEQELEF